MRIPLGAIIGRDILLPRGDVLEAEHALEHLEGGFGLVEGDLVAGFVDAGEGEIAVLADFAVLGAGDREGGVAGFGEVGGVGVVDAEGGGFAAEPVADVVGVAIDCEFR